MFREMTAQEVMSLNGGYTVQVTRGGKKYNVTISNQAQQQYGSFLTYTFYGSIAAALTGGGAGVFTALLAAGPIEIAAQVTLAK